MRALVVDDSLPARRHAGRMLADLGFEVWEATDGENALTVLRQLGTADLVLLDWNMPCTDGMWFLRAVRRDHAHDAMAVVMATGNADTESLVQALDEGANEYLMKPFAVDDLAAKLRILGFAFPEQQA